MSPYRGACCPPVPRWLRLEGISAAPQRSRLCLPGPIVCGGPGVQPPAGSMGKAGDLHSFPAITGETSNPARGFTMKNISWGMLESPSRAHVRFNSAKKTGYREPAAVRGVVCRPVRRTIEIGRNCVVRVVFHGKTGAYPPSGSPFPALFRFPCDTSGLLPHPGSVPVLL